MSDQGAGEGDTEEIKRRLTAETSRRFHTILAHAKTISDLPKADAQLAERLDKVELLIEQFGRTAELSVSLGDYIKDLHVELRSLRKIRVFALGTVLLFIFFLCFVVAYSVFWHSFWVFMGGPYYRAALFVSSIAASTLLLALVLKGSFRTVAERNADDLVPGHLKEMIAVVNNVIKQ